MILSPLKLIETYNGDVASRSRMYSSCNSGRKCINPREEDEFTGELRAGKNYRASPRVHYITTHRDQCRTKLAS